MDFVSIMTNNAKLTPAVKSFNQDCKQGTCVTEEKSPYAAVDRRNPERSLELAMAAAKVAIDDGGRDIVILDMSNHTALFDYFVIATGTSRRQLHAMSEDIDHKLEDDLHDKRMNIDGYDESRWIVLDYATVVVHLFDEETRQFYDLEALWGDAPHVDISSLLPDSSVPQSE